MKELVETINFEGIAPPGASGTPISDGYDGFRWSDTEAVVSQDLTDEGYGQNGYVSDLHSGNSVGFVDGGTVGTMSADRPFRLVDGYFAAAWGVGMTVTVDGYRHGAQVAEKHFTVDDTTSTLIHFGRSFTHLDSVTFTASGGSPDPITGYGGTQIVMEDLKVRAAPFQTSDSVHQDALDHHQADHAPVSEGLIV